MTAHIATRIVDSTRTNISGVGDNTNYTLPTAATVVILCSSVGDGGDRFLASESYELSYSANGGTTWFVVPVGGTSAVPHIVNSTGASSLVDETVVSNANRRAAPASEPTDGFIPSGKEHETGNSKNYDDRVDDEQTEAQFALDFSDCAAETTWDFRIAWGSRSGTTNINQTANVTTPAAAGGTDHTEAPSDASTSLDSQSSVKGKEVEGREDATAVEVLSPVLGKQETPSDAAGALDGQALAHESVRALSDEATAVDEVATTQGKSSDPSDAATAVDEVATTRGVSASPSDETSAVDGLATTSGAVATPNDAASATDELAVTRAATIAPSDAVSATGDPDPIRGRVESPSDSVSAVDGVARGLGRSVKDAASAIGDPDPQKTGQETATPSDSAEAVDSQLLAVGKSHSETAEAVDSLTTTRAKSESPGDSASAVDGLSPTQGQTQESSDAVSAVDSLAAVHEAVVAPSDTTEAVDSLEVALLTTISDATSVVDELLIEKAVAFSDGVAAIGDPDPVHTADSGDVERSQSDGGVAGDSLGIDIGRAIADGASAVESQDDIRGAVDDNYAREVVSAIEALSPTRGKVAKVPTDAVSSVDGQKVELSSGLAEATSCGDSLSVEIGLHVADSALANDLLIASYTYFENISATDTLTTSLTIGLASDILGRGVLTGQSPPELLMEGEALALLDIYNISLNALGVGTLSATTDTSPQATILNNVWPSFRQQFLTDYSWNGAKKSVALSRLQDYAGADVTPAGDRWSFAYVLPDDYLRVLRINGFERFNKTQSMLQNAFEVEVVNYANTASTTADVRCLLTDETGTINLEYIFDPGNDNLELLGSKTTHALGLSLAHYVARNFGKTPQEIEVLSNDARRAITDAKGVDGQEKTQRLRADMTILESRYWWVG